MDGVDVKEHNPDSSLGLFTECEWLCNSSEVRRKIAVRYYYALWITHLALKFITIDCPGCKSKIITMVIVPKETILPTQQERSIKLTVK